MPDAGAREGKLILRSDRQVAEQLAGLGSLAPSEREVAKKCVVQTRQNKKKLRARGRSGEAR
jgi:hypothetical protein